MISCSCAHEMNEWERGKEGTVDSLKWGALTSRACPRGRVPQIIKQHERWRACMSWLPRLQRWSCLATARALTITCSPSSCREIQKTSLIPPYPPLYHTCLPVVEKRFTVSMLIEIFNKYKWKSLKKCIQTKSENKAQPIWWRKTQLVFFKKTTVRSEIQPDILLFKETFCVMPNYKIIIRFKETSINYSIT